VPSKNPMFANSTRGDQSALPNEIESAFSEGRAPFFPLGDAAGWSAALDYLFTLGRLEPVVHAAGHFRTAFPTSDYVRNLCRIFELMPPADEKSLPFHDVFGDEVQIVRRENAKTVMMVFCGRGHRAGAPLCLLHRWLGRLPVSLVYLRDFRRLYYLAGIESLGQDRVATLASLRSIVSSLGGQRILCYGNSAGVFAALHYGLDLESEAVLCLSGPTNTSAEFNAHLRSAEIVAQVNREVPHAMVDLRRAYRTAKQPPRVRLVYAENNWDDRLHAEHMSGLPTVTLQAIPNIDSHAVVRVLVLRREFEGLLDWLVSS
jgi:hypothetical protein